MLSASFARFHPGVPFFVLLADELDGWFDPADEPFELIQQDLHVPNLDRLRFHYTVQEFSYALTPSVLIHLLDAGFDRVVFLKQESMILGGLDDVFQAMEGSSVLLTPHLLEPLGDESVSRELNVLQSGVYNGGFIGVAETPAAREFLVWWQERLRTHCIRAVAEGLHFEQRWLDLVPALFDGVHVSRDPGLNVGHWHFPERRVSLNGDEVRAGDAPCSLFRFSGFDVEQPEAITRYSARLTMENAGPAAEIFRRYRDLLIEAGYFASRAWPYAYANFDNGVPIPDLARRIYREMGDDVERFGNPFQTTMTGSFYDWLITAGRDPGDGDGALPPLWREVYRQRPDVRLAHPDPCGTGHGGFSRWVREFGSREYGIAPELLPDARSGGNQGATQ